MKVEGVEEVEEVEEVERANQRLLNLPKAEGLKKILKPLQQAEGHFNPFNLICAQAFYSK